MTIAINAKYNIGDTIYVADYFDEFIPKACVINEIQTITSKIGTCIKYRVDDGEWRDFYQENRCFATYAECLKWCKEYS